MAKKNKGKKNARKSQMVRFPLANETKYDGPIVTPDVKEACDLHTILLGYSNSVSANGSGVIAVVFDAYNQASASANWSDCQAMFTEYRILGYHFKWLPVNKYGTGTSYFPIVSVTERGDDTNLSSLSSASSYASSREHYITDTFTREIRMDGVDEAKWTKMATSPATSDRLYVKLYGGGFTNSQTYGQYISHILVQFRGVS